MKDFSIPTASLRAWIKTLEGEGGTFHERWTFTMQRLTTTIGRQSWSVNMMLRLSHSQPRTASGDLPYSPGMRFSQPRTVYGDLPYSPGRWVYARHSHTARNDPTGAGMRATWRCSTCGEFKSHNHDWKFCECDNALCEDCQYRRCSACFQPICEECRGQDQCVECGEPTCEGCQIRNGERDLGEFRCYECLHGSD
jgi:hypothetical protein